MIKCNLAYMLDKFRITQKELADATGIPKNTINRYYNNTWTTINRDHIEELCNFFTCSVGDLIEVYSNTIHPNQMKLDLENIPSTIHEDIVDYTSKSRVQKPMDMIKQFNKQMQSNQNEYDNLNLFSGVGGLNKVQFKKEIVNDVSTEVYQRLIEYFNTLETDSKDKNKE
ncbi:helix-turn-helix transcriptional regulator [uncultured Clostridium sp.]|uniref:helix-turn-helix domain-containing protein n=1 Tax=uncultured Clostridium sp. TaxID=59620 RepID=UPI00321741F3